MAAFAFRGSSACLPGSPPVCRAGAPLRRRAGLRVHVPADQQQYIALNADLSRSWPSITKTKAPLPEAEEWKDKTDKLQYLQR